MKKSFKYLLALILALSVLIPLQALAVIEDTPNVKMFVGEKKTLTAVIDLVTNEDPNKLKIAWESENPDIAKVDSRGQVTGISGGKARINAIVSGNQSIKASVIVEVISTVKDLKVKKSTISLSVGEKLPIEYEVLPSNAYLKDVKFKSADNKIAKVDSKGIVTALKGGTTEITVTTVDGNIEKIITVNAVSTVKSVEFLDIQNEITIKQGEEKILKHRVLPSNAYLKDVKFKSSGPKIALINKDGVLTGISGGQVKITIETVDGGYTDEITVNVIGEPPVLPTSINIQGTKNRNIYVSQEEVLKTDLFPVGYNYDVKVGYISSNPEILSVNRSGKVTALAKGTATITAVASGRDGEIKDTVTYNIISTVTGIEGPKEMTIYVGEEKEVAIRVLPATAFDKKVIVKLDNRGILKVNESKDTIIGLQKGTVNALFTTNDGGFTHEMKIHVVGMVKSVDIPFNKLEMGLQPVIIEPVFNPTNALNKKLKYEIEGDRGVISINSGKNEIRPIKEGEVKVKVTSEDGGYTDEFIVVVKFDIKNLQIYDENDKLVGISDPESGKPIVRPSEPNDDGTNNGNNNSSGPSIVKKIIIQKLIDRTDNPLVKKALEQLLIKYS